MEGQIDHLLRIVFRSHVVEYDFNPFVPACLSGCKFSIQNKLFSNERKANDHTK